MERVFQKMKRQKGRGTLKRYLSVFVSVVMIMSTIVTANAATSQTFTDVPATHWAYSFIEQAAADGIVAGVGNGKFNPGGTVSNAEFGAMAARLLLEDLVEVNTESYNSRNEAWYITSPARLYTNEDKWWAPYLVSLHTAQALDGLTLTEQGGNYRDRWDISVVEIGISRYDMAQLIYNLMNSYRDVLDKPSDSAIEDAKSDISDWNSIPTKYQDAVAACYAAGYLSGVDSTGRFNGTATMSRAEAATVVCRLADAKDGDDATPPSESTKPSETTPPTGETGNKDADGHTTAASVNSVKDRGKSDEYPTTGNSETVSNNGYYTGANVDVGNAVLVYDFLDWVNEARREAGVPELQWVQSDAAEEYTLVRAMDLTKNFSHFGQHAGCSTEVIAGGGGAGSDEIAFDLWMESEGHYRTLMDSDRTQMCAAKCDGNWIITMWFDSTNQVERWAANDYLPA